MNEVLSVIDKDVILVNLAANNKHDILEALANAFSEAGYVTDVESYIADVYEREEEGSTGIGNYIAIPHGKSDSVVKSGVAIGILQDEIDWETLDDHGVRVVILFAVGADTESSHEHLRMLSLFARQLGKDEVVEQLLHATVIDDVVAAFE